MPARVLIIGWSKRYRKYVLDAVQELGLDAYLVLYKPLSQLPTYVKDVLILPELYNDSLQWIEQIVSYARSCQIDAVFTQEDPFVELAARVCKVLGLPGPDPDIIRRANDKWATREYLSAGGLPGPSYACVTSLAEAEEALKTFNFPVVVKPIGCAGGDGASKLNDRRGLPTAWKFAQRAYQSTSLEYQKVLIEEFIPGPLISVETLVLDNKFTTIAVTDCLQFEMDEAPFCSRFIHNGPVLPSTLDKSTINAVIRTTEKAIQILNIENGIVHTELKASPSGGTIIEINPRLPGVFVPELIHRATGVNWALVGILLALGEKPNLTIHRHRGTCVRLFVPKEEGVVEKITGFDAIIQLPHVVRAELWVKEGDHITTPVRGDIEERMGYVLTEHESSEKALEAALEAENLLKVSLRTESCIYIS